MAKLPTWKTLSKEKRTNIEYLRGFNVVCVERLGRVFFDYRGEIIGEYLGGRTLYRLEKGLPSEALQVVGEFMEDMAAGVYRYPVVITQN